MATTKPKIELSKHPDYRVIHVNGFFGGLNPSEGSIAFFTDILEPKMKDGEPIGGMQLDKINREMQIEIRMSTIEFVGLADWMNKHVKRLVDQGIIKKEDLKESTNADLYTT